MQQDLFDEKDEKAKALKDLCKIADAMESVERGTQFYKDLARDYKTALVAAGITKPNGKLAVKSSMEIKPNDIRNSKKLCLQNVIKALDDFSVWQESIKALYIGELGHIAFSYNVNHNGFGHEVQFMITDQMYHVYSGYVAVKNRVSLVTKKQLEGYGNLEYGLIKFGLALVKDKRVFHEKYAVPYNEKIKKGKEQNI